MNFKTEKEVAAYYLGFREALDLYGTYCEDGKVKMFRGELAYDGFVNQLKHEERLTVDTIRKKSQESESVLNS